MQLSENFYLSEFKCKDGTEVPEHLIPNVQKLACALQTIRDYFNKPLTITSGYRTPEHNRKVGGVSDSEHIFGTAADIKVKGVHPRIVTSVIKQLIFQGLIPEGGVGLYSTFVHYDIRGTRARWYKV